MSIVDSSVDRAEAEGKLAALDIHELRRDHEYWATKRLDHVDEYNGRTT